MSDDKTTAETRYIKDAIEGAELEMSIDSQIADYRRAIVVWLRRKESKWRRTASAGFGAASDAASFYAAAYHNAADAIERGEPERKMENNDRSPTLSADQSPTADPPTRIPAKGGDEHDVFSGWRRVTCWTQRPGACHRAKRSYNRRLRSLARRILAGADDA